MRKTSEEKIGTGTDKVSNRSKWTYSWQGPFKVVEEAGPKHYWLEVNGKRVKSNINRMQKKPTFSDSREDTADWVTDLALKASGPAYEPLVIEDEFNSYSEPQIGEMIVFPMKPDKHCKNPFGIGKVLKNTGDELEIQWFGSIAG